MVSGRFRSSLVELEAFLHKDISFVKGVGPKLSSVLSNIGVRTVWDALSHIPRTYSLVRCYEDINQLKIGDSCNLLVKVIRKNKTKNVESISCKILDPVSKTPSSVQLELLFFHRSNHCHALVLNTTHIIRGTISSIDIFGNLQIAHPEYISHDLRAARLHKYISPVYSVCHGVTNKKFIKIIAEILRVFPEQHLRDIQEITECDKLPSPSSLLEWIKTIHAVTDDVEDKAIKLAKENLAFLEMLSWQIRFLKERSLYKSFRSLQIPSSNNTARLLQEFSHSLTSCQKKAWEQISKDLQKEEPMMRLIHADVGSGKSIIAFLSLVQTASFGAQSALLAPTSILAKQHFSELCRLTKNISEISIDLFIGGKKNNTAALEDGKTNIVIGTHALIQENVTFKNLSLVVIDEQQRFGVNQRLSLVNKGLAPHLLLLSATPIPRTFELMIYGDLDVSRLKKKPFESDIDTRIIHSSKIPELIDRIRVAVLNGKKVYWVCPFISGDKESTVEKRGLSLTIEFPGKVGVLHGRMTLEEKTTAIEQFKSGKTLLLVSTTVVEVGVHVSNASIMVIERSNMLGLSQLHQLRGRIARDCDKGLCFLLYDDTLSEVAKERLQAVRNSSDGFEIAEKDWSLRGAGEIIGIRQSGHKNFKFIDDSDFFHLIDSARDTAKYIAKKTSKSEKSKLFSEFLENLFFKNSQGVTRAG
ncbi:ATP-dependent DNA helicase RecG [Candidatus Hydrogenosomobacter endosymbioticus]|uniref:ATP-dependent DNA helicase RecG n=1 Tax=Candidatus Hydrogenosomobacter endosymbioticus TaxID=2558174 RepID=UPI001F44388C|nr:ATP-dependent DNA helicase RecG [Candidatus Hydrogenosomobacter endosymbioticus]